MTPKVADASKGRIEEGIFTTPLWTLERGRRLKHVRTMKMRLRGGDFGRRLGITASDVSRIEWGKITCCPKFTTARIRAVLGPHYRFVMTGSGAEKYQDRWPKGQKYLDWFRRDSSGEEIEKLGKRPGEVKHGENKKDE